MRYLPTTMPTFVTLKLGAVLAAALFPTSEATTAVFTFTVDSITPVFAPISSSGC